MSAAKTPGEIFKEARLQKGLTQLQVAEAAGINANTYAKIERGEQVPTLMTMKNIAKTLNINVSSIIEALD
jgi:transcriptional regulator with XRE-family HTH domain